MAQRRPTLPRNAPRWHSPAFVREGVLVADDDLHVRRLLLAALRQHGFVPVNAVSCQEALERTASPPRLDVLVTDLFPPEMCGHEIARRWRLGQPRLKAVCLRAEADVLFDAHVRRPLSLDGLWDCVASLLHADVTARCDLRLWYSMVFAEVSDELRAQACGMLVGTPEEMKGMNAVIQILAELPREDPVDQEMRRRRDEANVGDDVRRLTRTWQFARLEKP
jgi:CheY-like chemotaxis protein